VSDISNRANHILKTRRVLNQIIAETTKQPLEKVERDTDRDYFLSAQDAQAYGLIDKVIEKI
jgi:ATP-dependent Clp protease protease subunit